MGLCKLSVEVLIFSEGRNVTLLSVTEANEVVGISDVIGIKGDFMGEVLEIPDIFDLVSVLGCLRNRFPHEPVLDSRSLKPAFT